MEFCSKPCNLTSCWSASIATGLCIQHKTLDMLVEQELIERARSGDAGAFNDVVLAYRKRILGTISRLIGMADRREHAVEIQTTAARHAEVRDEIERRAATYDAYDRLVGPRAAAGAAVR